MILESNCKQIHIFDTSKNKYITHDVDPDLIYCFVGKTLRELSNNTIPVGLYKMMDEGIICSYRICNGSQIDALHSINLKI